MSARDADDRRLERRAVGAAAVLLVAGVVGTCIASADEPRWRARYYPNPSLEGTPLERWEHEMRFEWDRGSPDPSIPTDGFSARFETCLVLPRAKRVVFLLTSDDGAHLEVDGSRVLDLSGDHARRSKGTEVELAAGAHLLRIDYRERGRRAVVGLSASIDGRAPRQIPNDRLRRPSRGRCDEAAR